MDIRTKLVFALVGVSLGGMFLLGWVTYTRASGLLRTSSLRQLQALAVSQEQGLENVVEGWRERVELLAVRADLRQALDAVRSAGTPGAADRVEAALANVVANVESVESLTAYDVTGEPVASAHREPGSERTDAPLVRLPRLGEPVVYQGASFGADGRPQVGFVSAVTFRGEQIGSLHVVLSAQELVNLTRGIRGLGNTGETMFVFRDGGGRIRILNPVREPGIEVSGLLLEERESDPATLALRGQSGLFSEGLTDYRGQAVWAATGYMPETGIGVVVKFDDAEEREPILRLRTELIQVALSLSAFAIVLGTLIGLRFAKPIHDLAEVANRIREGEINARADASSEDEIGLLALTFNQMTDELERRMSLLHEFHRFFDVSIDMLCIANTDGYFTRINPAFERTLGWPKEELLSKSFMEFVHPDDIEATLHEIDKLSRGIPTISFENRYRCADGSYKHLLWTSYPEPGTGVLYAVARDMTDLILGQEQSLQHPATDEGELGD